jgi:hypothetical protein
VVLNGVLDTHHDCDAANQVLGPVDDVANNVIGDTSRFAADADNCWAVRCTNSSIVLAWKLPLGATAVGNVRLRTSSVTPASVPVI